MVKFIKVFLVVAMLALAASCGSDSATNPDAGGVIGGDCIVSRSAIDTCTLK
jgi:hypothetical protein